MAAPISFQQAIDGFSDPLFSDSGIVPVVDIFYLRFWRLTSLSRIYAYFLLEASRTQSYYFVWRGFHLRIWLISHAARLLDFQDFFPDGPPSIKRSIFRLTIVFMKRWPNYFFTFIWWYCYHCFADEGEFEADYVAAWRHRFQQSDSSGLKGTDLHIYVGKSYLRAPIPAGPDDEATFRALQMWYCMIQSNKGLGEVFLPKRLTNIDKVQVGVTNYCEILLVNALRRSVILGPE